MSVVTQPKSFHVSFMVFAMILCATSTIVWCAAWFASKQFQERQRELENSGAKKTIITVISTIIAALFCQRAKGIWKTMMARNAGYESPEITSGKGGPIARARSAIVR